jgi:hypothetical protein
MRVEGALDYPGVSAAQVFSMIIDPDFQRAVCAATGALSFDVDIQPSGGDIQPSGGDIQPSGSDIQPSGGEAVVTTRRVMPTDGLPDFVRSLVRNGIELIETQHWAPVAADGSRTAQVRLSFTGQPMTMTGQLRMTEDGVGTALALIADLRAGIPIFGGRIEKASAPLILSALKTEQDLGRTWLSEHG